MLTTARLRLVPWEERHRADFHALHDDPQVTADLGGPFSIGASDAKFSRYLAAEKENEISRWAVENHAGLFVGYSGVMRRSDCDHPLGLHHEVGWRFIRKAWGHGYATESARAALSDAFRRLPIKEIVSYTSSDNARSQAVMRRLGLQRDASRDFLHSYDTVGSWGGHVWVAVRDVTWSA